MKLLLAILFVTLAYLMPDDSDSLEAGITDFTSLHAQHTRYIVQRVDRITNAEAYNQDNL